MAEVFDRVIDDGRMLRNFVQIMRSGVVGPEEPGHAAQAARTGVVRPASSDEQVFPRFGR